MKKKRDKENAQWTEAHRQAAKIGIVLTRRKNSKGEYVCFMTAKAKKGWSL